MLDNLLEVVWCAKLPSMKQQHIRVYFNHHQSRGGVDGYLNGFYFGFTNICWKGIIFVVVDRLSKYAHFMALKHPFTAVEVAQCYLDNVFKFTWVANKYSK